MFFPGPKNIETGPAQKKNIETPGPDAEKHRNQPGPKTSNRCFSRARRRKTSKPARPKKHRIDVFWCFLRGGFFGCGGFLADVLGLLVISGFLAQCLGVLLWFCFELRFRRDQMPPRPTCSAEGVWLRLNGTLRLRVLFDWHHALKCDFVEAKCLPGQLAQLKAFCLHKMAVCEGARSSIELTQNDIDAALFAVSPRAFGSLPSRCHSSRLLFPISI